MSGRSGGGAPAAARAKPVDVALLGVGVVGRGVYETLKRYRERFEIRHVVVREPARYLDLRAAHDRILP